MIMERLKELTQKDFQEEFQEQGHHLKNGIVFLKEQFTKMKKKLGKHKTKHKMAFVFCDAPENVSVDKQSFT